MVIASGIRHGHRLLVLGFSAEQLRDLQHGQSVRVSSATHQGCPSECEFEIVSGATERALSDWLVTPGALGADTLIVGVARESEPVSSQKVHA